MGGNQEGAKKAIKTRLAKDPDYFKNIGALGGAKGKGRIPWNKGRKVKKNEGNTNRKDLHEE